jgi:hypothetical protein
MISAEFGKNCIPWAIAAVLNLERLKGAFIVCSEQQSCDGRTNGKRTIAILKKEAQYTASRHVSVAFKAWRQPVSLIQNPE